MKKPLTWKYENQKGEWKERKKILEIELASRKFSFFWSKKLWRGKQNNKRVKEKSKCKREGEREREARHSVCLDGGVKPHQDSLSANSWAHRKWDARGIPPVDATSIRHDSPLQQTFSNGKAVSARKLWAAVGAN